MTRPAPLFEIGYWGGHYLRSPGPQGRPEDRAGDFAGDARELRSLFPFEVTAEVEETAYGVSYSAVAEVVQILASDSVTAIANLAQVASAAVGVVAFFRKRLSGGQFFVSQRVAEGLCAADAIARLSCSEVEILTSVDVPAGSELLPIDLGVRNLEARTYLIALRMGGGHGRVLLYTIRSDQKIMDVREVETDYSEWYRLGHALSPGG